MQLVFRTGEFLTLGRMLVGASAALMFCACGSSNGSDAGTDSQTDAGPVVDNAPAFVGTWTGTVSLIDPPSGDVIESGEDSFVISEVTANTLSIADICPDLSGPTATVTSATQFAIPMAHACPADTMETACSSIVITYNTLAGTLSGGALSLAGSLTAVGCGLTVNENVTFVSGPGTKK
jgi:hypothetical protein